MGACGYEVILQGIWVAGRTGVLDIGAAVVEGAMDVGGARVVGAAVLAGIGSGPLEGIWTGRLLLLLLLENPVKLRRRL